MGSSMKCNFPRMHVHFQHGHAVLFFEAKHHIRYVIVTGVRTCVLMFFFSSRRRHTRSDRDWSSDVCSSDLNLDIAQVQVQNRVSIAQPILPAEVQRQGITVKKASPDITLVIQVFSPDKSLDTLYTSNYVTLQIRDELARLPGVGDILVFGARDYSMRLWLRPGKLGSRGIAAGGVGEADQGE